MRSLVIGAGQIGEALATIFSKYGDCQIRDIESKYIDGKVDVMHIAFPYSSDFVDAVIEYKLEYNPRLTIIHSSVPVGTTDQCAPYVVHSPERGRFPNLVKEMKSFPKYVGGRSLDDVLYAKDFFERCQWQVRICSNPCLTEMLKLISNVHMGLEIAWRQEVQRMLPPGQANVYKEWERDYYSGYRRMGQEHLVRPRMLPGPIGGHCILPCTEMLSEFIDSKALEFIKESNEKAIAEQSKGNGVHSRCRATV